MGICILAGAATGTLVAIITTISTPAVHADTETNRPAAVWYSAQPASPSPVMAAVANPTPASLAPQKPASELAATQQSVPNQAKGKKHFSILHGFASWYGGVFNGRKTANGEKFDKNALTACHPTLPFGSLVKVINRANKRSVVVRINDRGDLGDGDRIIDLSWAAANKLAMVQTGVVKVDVEVLSMGHDNTSSNP